jgi:hypothetical protein
MGVTEVMSVTIGRDNSVGAPSPRGCARPGAGLAAGTTAVVLCPGRMWRRERGLLVPASRPTATEDA